MKITRRQLKDFIKEELTLSADSMQKAVDAVKAAMTDGEADVADAKAAAEEATGTEMGPEDFKAFAQDAGLSTTTVDKVVAEGARIKISKAKIRQIIKEEVSRAVIKEDEIDLSKLGSYDFEDELCIDGSEPPCEDLADDEFKARRKKPVGPSDYKAPDPSELPMGAKTLTTLRAIYLSYRKAGFTDEQIKDFPIFKKPDGSPIPESEWAQKRQIPVVELDKLPQLATSTVVTKPSK